MRRTFTAAELVSHADGVRALARGLVADASTADDLVQDACLAALARPPEEEMPPRAWFIGVVRNLARRSHRSHTSRRRRERVAAKPESVPAAVEAVSQLETHRRLVDVVMLLRDPYRTAIVLRYFDGLAPREIAERLNVSPATVHTWVHRGLAMLRGRLESKRHDWRVALLPLLDAPSRRLPIPAIGVLAVTTNKSAAVLLVCLVLLGGVGVVFAVVTRAPELAVTEPLPENSRDAHRRRASVSVGDDHQATESLAGPDTAAGAAIERLIEAVVSTASGNDWSKTGEAMDALARSAAGRSDEVLQLVTKRLASLTPSERPQVEAALVGALGRVPDAELLMKLLDLPVSRDVIYDALAQDRGGSSRDAAGPHLSKRWELTDVAEPQLRARLLGELKTEVLIASAGGDARPPGGMLGLAQVLSLSAHRDPAIDDYLRKLSKSDDETGNTVATSYLGIAQSPYIREVAISVLRDPTRRERLGTRALSALGRSGENLGEDAHTVLTAYRESDRQGQLALIQGLPGLLFHRRGGEVPLALVHLLHEGLSATDVRLGDAAASAAGSLSNLFGWNGIGLDPRELLRRPGLSTAAKASVMRAWAGQYVSLSQTDHHFEEALADSSVPSAARAAAWQTLGRTAAEHSDRVPALAARLVDRETDEDLREVLRAQAGSATPTPVSADVVVPTVEAIQAAIAEAGDVPAQVRDVLARGDAETRVELVARLSRGAQTASSRWLLTIAVELAGDSSRRVASRNDELLERLFSRDHGESPLLLDAVFVRLGQSTNAPGISLSSSVVSACVGRRTSQTVRDAADSFLADPGTAPSARAALIADLRAVHTNDDEFNAWVVRWSSSDE